ncbi:GNAT family N-acetyltransferase [Niastella caeni]|uniref:GNAT family N-acetyltransferase n=1 Tax=Niastella caeni TaxID=2569763 RepID=A0A4S8HUI1_9BACT|nr:GNAT family N-acetyltransferase [Niastella caeni]THU39263.1 GNAT family N-acetyltransferase [Niastella caeni]
MEKIMSNAATHRHTAEQINYTALINSYCREFSNWSRYQGIPRYDDVLADWFHDTGHTMHVRIDFTSIGSEVYIPLQYYSETGIHSFYFPVAERELATNSIQEISPFRFLDLVTQYAQTNYPEAKATRTAHLMQNSIDNLGIYLDRFESNQPAIDNAQQTFIEAEQSLLLGHSLHPLTKTREGFTTDDLLQYSPETQARFPLYYFLIHPEYVIEKSTEATLPCDCLKQELMAGELSPSIKTILREYYDYKIVPTHPWEARYLLQQPEVQEMQAKGLLFSLGEAGAAYAPTSSVRTVYNEQSDWMYKLSLHVKITNSYRVNYPHELYRGHDAARLMKTSWGKALQQSFPEVEFITDPACIMVTWNGAVIDGFTTSIRKNVFKGSNAQKNVSLVAALCQDGIAGNTPRIVNIIRQAAKRRDRPVPETALDWFTQYLNVCVKPLIGIFNQFGLGSEYHQQNILLEMDANLFPAKIYFRDNQGFFFREGKVNELLQVIPDFGNNSRSFIPEERMYRYWDHYLISNNLFGLVNALGKNKLADEVTLLRMTYELLSSLRETDTTGLVNHFLTSSKLNTKGNLLTSLNNMDEASAPRTNPAVYRTYYNPLNKYFFSNTLINPASKETLYSRYFSKENVTISVRPMDLDRDLEMLHEWFHREHALKIWQMNWPISKLETYYRTLLPGDMLYAYIGEANGEPSFYFEVYWAIRDLVGEYYDVLPTDYGTHQYIASIDPKKKYVSPSTQCMVDYVFAQPQVGKMVGEGSVDSLASLMNKLHVGFKIEKVIEMPHKKANLNFCYREWYWAKFPQNKNIIITPNA